MRYAILVAAALVIAPLTASPAAASDDPRASATAMSSIRITPTGSAERCAWPQAYSDRVVINPFLGAPQRVRRILRPVRVHGGFVVARPIDVVGPHRDDFGDGRPFVDQTHRQRRHDPPVVTSLGGRPIASTDTNQRDREIVDRRQRYVQPGTTRIGSPGPKGRFDADPVRVRPGHPTQHVPRRGGFHGHRDGNVTSSLGARR